MLIEPSNTNGFLSLNDFYDLGDKHIKLFEDKLWRIREMIKRFNKCKVKGAEVYLDASDNPIEYCYTLYVKTLFHQTYHMSNVSNTKSVTIESDYNIGIIHASKNTMIETKLIFKDKTDNYYLYDRQWNIINMFDTEDITHELDLESCARIKNIDYFKKQYCPWF